jgi:hypothetical protein
MAHYKGPPSLTEWCGQFTRELVDKTAGTLGPLVRTALVAKFGLSEQVAEEIGHALAEAVEADAVATDEALAEKLLSVFGKIIPHAGNVAGWGGVGLSAALAVYEFKRGDGFAGISQAGSAAFGVQTMLEVLPALPEIGATAAFALSVAPPLLFAAEVMAAQRIYEQALVSLNKGFRAQHYGGDPAVIRLSLVNALPEQRGPCAAQARYAQAKAFNDFLDHDFLSGGWGLWGGGGHRDFTDFLQKVVPRWGPEWREAVTRFFGRRSHISDAANEEWIAQQMQTIALRFMDEEMKSVGR